MSRSQKKKKKQKRNLIIGISTIAIVGTVAALYFFGVFAKWFADEVIPDKIEEKKKTNPVKRLIKTIFNSKNK